MTLVFKGECDPDFGSQFKFSLHEKELKVGDVPVFVRIYNEQSTFPLEVEYDLLMNCEFMTSLISESQRLHNRSFRFPRLQSPGMVESL